MKEKLKRIWKKIFSGGLGILLVTGIAAAAIGLFWGTCSIVVGTMEKETTQRVEGIAQQDGAAVQSAVANWERSVADWAGVVRNCGYTDMKDLFHSITLGSQIMGCEKLYLVDQSAYYYDNNGLITPKPEYDTLLKNMEGDSLLQTKDGKILVCWKLNPFSVEYNRFTHAMAEFSMFSLRTVLANTINGEESYCGILDKNGSFLVDGIEDGRSFYGVMDQTQIHGYKSAKDLRNAVQGKNPLRVSCKQKDGQSIFITTQLPELDWTLLTLHPTTPVVSLKNPILVNGIVLCVLLAIAVVGGFVLLSKVQLERMQKTLVQRRVDNIQKKLDTALEANEEQERKYRVLSRDMVTGMTSIMGYRSLADKHRNDPNSVKVFLEKLEDAAEQLQSILDPGWVPPVKEFVSTGEESSVDVKGKRILLVEDNELNREMAAFILGEAGMIVDQAENGQEGFQKVAVTKPGNYYDLVLMDIEMPVRNGLEAAQDIRRLRNKRMAEVPILALTASVSPEDKQKAFQAGMDGYVEKPLDLEKLIRAIQNALKQAKL